MADRDRDLDIDRPLDASNSTFDRRDVDAEDEVGGEVVGGAGGAVAGAVVGGVVGGPVGAAVGGVIGATTGGIGGAAAGAVIDPPSEVRTYVTTNQVQPVYLDGEVVVGAALPPTVQLAPIPEYEYQYVYVNGQPVLVEPASRQIVYVVR